MLILQIALGVYLGGLALWFSIHGQIKKDHDRLAQMGENILGKRDILRETEDEE